MAQKTNRKTIDPDFWEDTLRPIAMSALLRLIEGEAVVKTKRQALIKNGKRTGHYKTTVTKSTRPPNVAAVIFAMERLFPERCAKRFLQLQEIEITFQHGFERPHCLAVSLDFKEQRKDPFPLKAHLSPHLKALQDQKTKKHSPILKSL